MSDIAHQQQVHDRITSAAPIPIHETSSKTSTRLESVSLVEGNNNTTFAVQKRQDADPAMVARYDGRTSAMEVCAGHDLSGRVAIVTGSNQGIGFETARTLALHGCRVVLACRSEEKGLAAVDKISTEMNNLAVTSLKARPPDVHFIHLDLASFRNVRRFAEEFKTKGWPLHYLVLNAGVFGLWYARTEDGWETTWQVNCLGHFHLTQLLLPLMEKASLESPVHPRVVVLSSDVHRLVPFSGVWPFNLRSRRALSPPSSLSYSDTYAYNVTKFVNVLFSMELNRRFLNKGSCVRSYCVHPGFSVKSGLGSHWFIYRLYFSAVSPFTKTLQQAAATSVYACVAPELEGRPMLYLANCRPRAASGRALDPDIARAVWTVCEEMVQETLDNIEKNKS